MKNTIIGLPRASWWVQIDMTVTKDTDNLSMEITGWVGGAFP